MSRVCYGYKSASDVFYLQNGFYRFNGKLKQYPYESISACNVNTRLCWPQELPTKLTIPGIWSFLHYHLFTPIYNLFVKYYNYFPKYYKLYDV